jgi:hypothetical protein
MHAFARRRARIVLAAARAAIDSLFTTTTISFVHVLTAFAGGSEAFSDGGAVAVLVGGAFCAA